MFTHSIVEGSNSHAIELRKGYATHLITTRQCVCVCVCEREREREDSEINETHLSTG